MATTDNLALRYYLETAYGEVPSPAPTLQTLLVTSESLTTSFQTKESEAVVGDRQVQDIVRVGRIAEGEINGELNFENFDDFMAGALACAWSSDVIANDSDLISYGLEKHATDLGIYYLFVGARVTTLAMSFELQSMITATIGLMAKGGVFDTSSVGDGSPTDAPANPPMTTLSTLAITAGGSPIECPTSFSFETTNELRQKRCLGNDDISGINLGIFRATGSLEAYFESLTYVNKIVADTATDFEIVAEDADANAYVISFPRVKFTTLDGPANTGRSQDLMHTLGWTAYRDPSTGITMRIERT